MKRVYLLLAIFSILSLAEKLEITADTFIAKDADKKVSFIGNAKIIQGNTIVRASRIILYFNEDNTTKMYKAMEGVRFHIQKQKVNYQGKCSKMEYFPKKKKYILSGNVKANDKYNKREIIADTIEINGKTGTFTIRGNKKRAATLTFDMK